MTHKSASEHSFQALDDLLAARQLRLRSLNPAKEVPTSFAELGRAIGRATDDRKSIAACKNLLDTLLTAVLDDFPDNIFLDLDFFVASVWEQGARHEKGCAYFFDVLSEKTSAVLELFGRKSVIRFRYLHDFVYGFDWAKWVQKEPEMRRFVDPFGVTFLDYLLVRGRELLELIDLDHQKYHRLSDESYRNPYAFSREPDEETQLLKHLARRQWVPVAAWDRHAVPTWGKPFHQLREEMALALQGK